MTIRHSLIDGLLLANHPQQTKTKQRIAGRKKKKDRIEALNVCIA